MEKDVLQREEERERERPAKRCWRLTEINEGERESERPNPPAECERYSPTFLKTLECDFRANADPERGLADPERGLPEPTASANASWSFPWLKCGVNAGGTFHTQTSLNVTQSITNSRREKRRRKKKRMFPTNPLLFVEKKRYWCAKANF